jgi:hypothetical protein
MRLFPLHTVFVLILAVPTARLDLRSAPPPGDFSSIRPLLEQYCLDCHEGSDAKGEVDFSRFTDTATLYRDLPLWDRVIDQVNMREMPPRQKRQPSEEERARLVAWFEHFREHLDFSQVPRKAGRPTLRRLNREEFSRSVRDLLRLDYYPGADLPADGSGGGGFDNNGDTLFLPPLLVERLVGAVHEAVARAFQDLRRVDELRPSLPREGVDATQAARENLERFVPRAFRRPVRPGELEALVAVFAQAWEKKPEFDPALEAAYRAVLLSPAFLFRVEEDRPGQQEWRITDHELATRLSYFFWSTLPDAELRELADRGELSHPAVLDAQVLRMLDDPRAEALARSFMIQWLGLRELEGARQPDPVRFPGFTAALRDAMIEEPVRFFHYLLQENRTLLNLIDSDFAFVNHRLAAHYGIPPAKTDGHGQEEVQLVRLPDRRRGGLLGMGAVHVVTSYPLRTSPVLRGKWILETLTGARIPPPPPGTGELPADDHELKEISLRERLAQHVSRPECIGCHTRMDPPGFALEHFDPTGRWRDQAQGRPVDAGGEMADGAAFRGVEDFKALLWRRHRMVMRQLTEKMLAYALGRGLEYTDQPFVHEMVTRLASRDWAARELLLEIVRSVPFQFRSAP